MRRCVCVYVYMYMCVNVYVIVCMCLYASNIEHAIKRLPIKKIAVRQKGRSVYKKTQHVEQIVHVFIKEGENATSFLTERRTAAQT